MSVKIEDPLYIHPPKEKKPLHRENGQRLREKLRAVFGYATFRGPQEEIIQTVLKGTDVFVIMPTGAGKSLCYQLPSLFHDRGSTLIISPLIALMKDQVDQLTARGVGAYFLNSTLSKRNEKAIKQKAIYGEARLLYISPECFCKEDNIDFFQRLPLGLVAIDESHCISEWGHDFRPKYRSIRPVLDQMKPVPIMALTASATPRVQADIRKNLRLVRASSFTTSFNRRNLYYQVLPKQGLSKELIRKHLIVHVRKHRKQMGIVYCLSRKTVEEVTALLCVNKVKALPYHAGLDAKTREKNQDAFLNEESHVIVATIAFGMGIDKSNIRFIIHFDAPKSLEGYYQETGRAGRDGKEAFCLMMFSPKDALRIERLHKEKPPAERENARKLFEEVIAYAQSPVCRRKNILQYFGEVYKENICDYCDNCRMPTPSFEAMPLLLLVLKAVEEIYAYKDISYIAKLLAGINNEEVQRYKHTGLSVFGKGKDKDAVFWRSVIRQAISYGFLSKRNSACRENDMLSLSEQGKKYLTAPYPIHFFEEHSSDATTLRRSQAGDPKAHASLQKHYDKKLLQLLEKLQQEVAHKKGLPPYIIFHPSSLREMAMIYPRTTEELSQIHGVGSGKVARFGKPFLQLIARYVDKHKIIPSPDIIVKSSVKSSGKRSRLRINIIQQIDRRIYLKEIMQSLGIPLQELIREIENICRSGTKLNLDYYLDHTMDKEQQEEIYSYFLQSQADDLGQALRAFKDCSEEGIRLMRVKFMCELGN